MEKKLKLSILLLSFLCQTIPSTSEPNTKTDIHFIGTWYGGLFATYNSVLNHLTWCEENNKIPFVFWDNRSWYYTPEGFNGSHNVWEYYFDPVSPIVPTYYPPIVLTFTPGPMKFYCENQALSIREEAYRLINKYIKIKPIVQSKIDLFYQKHMNNKKTIGIHLRGTDKISEEKPISAEKIVLEALKFADHDTQFLVATDEEPLLNKIINLLSGYNVIFYDCFRSDNGKPLPLRSSYYYKPSFAQLGEDVVVEVALLSKCNRLIHTMSNVSTVALYMNPSMEHALIRDDSYNN